MEKLKTDIDSLTEKQIERVNEQESARLEQIQEQFAKLRKLSKNHVERGAKYQKTNENSTDLNQELMDQFDKESEDYEKIISEANMEKHKLRQEISKLEQQIRVKRDGVADIEVQNRNLKFLFDKENEINVQKDKLEGSALKYMSYDLDQQMAELQKNAQNMNGKITPFGMEQVLQEKFAHTSQQYQDFI